MEEFPSLVVLTLHDKEGEDVVRGILDVGALPSPTVVQDGIKSWLWEMENKYYTADVQVASVECPENHMQWILNSGEAVVIYFDSMQDATLESLNSVLETLGDFEPEVQLLLCDSCASEECNNGLSRLKAQQWCISNGWELIELIKVDDEDSCHEDDFQESWGFQRIRQALHAHTWSNLKMKEKSNSFNTVMQSVVSMDERKADKIQSSKEVMYTRLEDLTVSDTENGEHVASSNQLQCHTDSQAPENGMNSSVLEDYLEKGDSDFERLFSNFEHMKRTAASLPPEHRRDYAEKVAISFWKAIGGPDEELDGLDSD